MKAGAIMQTSKGSNERLLKGLAKPKISGRMMRCVQGSAREHRKEMKRKRKEDKRKVGTKVL
jgi:hypothetical protein